MPPHSGSRERYIAHQAIVSQRMVRVHSLDRLHCARYRALHCRRPRLGSGTEAWQALKLHGGALQGLLAAWFQQHGVHEPRDGGVVGEEAHAHQYCA
jgi:hypothetical protein